MKLYRFLFDKCLSRYRKVPLLLELSRMDKIGVHYNNLENTVFHTKLGLQCNSGTVMLSYYKTYTFYTISTKLNFAKYIIALSVSTTIITTFKTIKQANSVVVSVDTCKKLTGPDKMILSQILPPLCTTIQVHSR